MTRPSEVKALCFGETLFDLMPSGKMPGGAPMNVALHLQNLGISSGVISRVGSDELGRELLALLKEKGVSTALVQVDETRPTGTVEVELDENKNATYNIVEDVSWDYVENPVEVIEFNPEYVIFGSLACRSEKSKASLLQLLNLTSATTVFDVNLRAPYYDETLIATLLKKANIVKMNEDEFELLKDWFGIKKTTLEAELAELQLKYPDLEMIIITLGDDGAIAWCNGKLFTASGISIVVEDTVGSGDSFLAAFISRYSGEESIEEALHFATAVGALVATQKGANPSYTEKDVQNLMK